MLNVFVWWNSTNSQNKMEIRFRGCRELIHIYENSLGIKCGGVGGGSLIFTRIGDAGGGLIASRFSFHSACGTLAGLVFAEQEGKRDQSDRHPGELHVDILIALHLCLAVELVVNVGHGQSFAVC